MINTLCVTDGQTLDTETQGLSSFLDGGSTSNFNHISYLKKIKKIKTISHE